MKPDLSVVVPTSNRMGLLSETLASLLRQSLAPARYEILVVDDGSTDGTGELLRGLARHQPGRLRVFHQSHQFSGVARNRGVQEAAAPLVLSFDDDEVACPELLARHWTLHQQYPAPTVAVAGRVLCGPDGVDLCDPDERRLPFVGVTAQGERLLSPALFSTQNVSFKREAVLAVGGFTPGLPRLDDLDLAFRLLEAGMQLLYCEEAACRHLRPLDTVEKVIASGRYYGRTLATWYERLPAVRARLPWLGAGFDGGWEQWRQAPWRSAKDALRRGLITPVSAPLLEGLARLCPVGRPPSRLLVRLCRELWAYHYRREFRLGRRPRHGGRAPSASPSPAGLS